MWAVVLAERGEIILYFIRNNSGFGLLQKSTDCSDETLKTFTLCFRVLVVQTFAVQK